MRKILSTTFFVFAGSFVITAMMMSFYKQPVSENNVKIWISVLMIVFAIIPLFVGLAIIKFKDWQKIIGIILMSSAALVAFVAFSFFCFFADEEFMKLMPPNTFGFMSDYFSGGVTTVLSGISGYILFKKANKLAK